MRCVSILGAVTLAAAIADLGCGGSSGAIPVQWGDDASSPAGNRGDGAAGAPGSAQDATVTDAAQNTQDATRTDADSVDASPAGSADARADAGILDSAVREGGDAQGVAPGDGSAGCGNAVLGGGPFTTTATHLDIGVHDPSMIWDGNSYFLFATGGTLNVRSSPDVRTYANAGNVFAAIPAWITTALGANPGSLWAPDISYFNGQFHVYYAGSTFGSNSSVIGLATSTSLKSARWVDQGMVVQSRTTDNFNAIDPNVSFDQACTPWLAFGSFWDGIKMRQLDPATGMVATSSSTTYSLASRGGGAIEGASIVSHNGFYYLFVSFDLCCQGISSTYRTMVGRATSITGPYTDKAGRNMTAGAAEQVLVTTGRYIGPGGGTAWKNGTAYLYAYHYYDGQANGASKLQIRPINFDATDWVVLGDPLFP